MMQAVQDTLSKSLALTLLALALLLLYVAAIAPVAGLYKSMGEQIEEQRWILGRYLTVAAQEPQAQVMHRQAKRSAASDMFLAGSSDAVRIAELQSRASVVAEAEGASIQSTRALPPRESEGLRLLGIEAHFTCTLEQLQRILHVLESNRPRLFVDALQVSPSRSYQIDDAPAGERKLDVHIEVLGAANASKG